MLGFLVRTLQKIHKKHTISDTYISGYLLCIALLARHVEPLEFVDAGVGLLREIAVDSVRFVEQVLVCDAFDLQRMRPINQLTLCCSTRASKASFFDFFWLLWIISIRI